MAAGEMTEQVAEQVAEELEHAAAVTRRLNGKLIGSVLIGVGIGVTVGFYIGYRYSKKKLRVEIFEEAEREILEIRDHYQQKIIAAEAQDKPSVKEIVAEKGYDTASEVDLPSKYGSVDVRPTRPPVPVQESPRGPFPPREIPTPIDPSARVFRTESAEKDKDEDWDYTIELARRNDLEPYIIHQDEHLLNESGYSQVSYIYYSIDDVLVDEDDPTTILNNRENLIGKEALERFGHGADDYNLVHVRNSELQMEFVINRISGSWEEEVLGLDRNDSN